MVVEWFTTHIRVAKFESKVGSRRTTIIGNLVVLYIFLVALILIPMQCVLSSQNDICLLEKERVRIKTSKTSVWTTFFKIFSQNYLVVRRATRSELLVVLTHFLVVVDTRTREFCYPVIYYERSYLMIYELKPILIAAM